MPAVPLQLPDQPVNAEPALALVVSEMVAPDATLIEHALPQEIPAGFEVTMPLPLPDGVTNSVIVDVVWRVNVAVQFASAARFS